MLALLACVELIKAMLWLLIIVVFAQAILSWTAPDGPFAGVLNALTFRFLAPIRRLIPPIGGTLDLSPLIVIVLAQLALMLPVRWLGRAPSSRCLQPLSAFASRTKSATDSVSPRAAGSMPTARSAASSQQRGQRVAQRLAPLPERRATIRA